MCAPAIIPVLAAAGGGAAASAAGATTLGIAAASAMGLASGIQAAAGVEAADYNEALAEQQNKQLQAEAKNVRIAGSQEAGRQWQETKKEMARGRAEFGARGISGATGTPEALIEDIAEVGTLESLTTVTNASREAFGLETKGQNLLERARVEKRQARTGAFTTILGSAASGYTSGLKFA